MLRRLGLFVALLLLSCSAPTRDSSCGECGPSETCDEREGVCVACTPQCGERACGDDGCGGSCGDCEEGLECNGAFRCGPPGCVPATCDELGLACGEGDDGCGAMIDCGGCPDGETCGGGGTPGACGTGGCENACTSEGATQCEGDGVVRCVVGTGGCLAWSSATPCTNGLVCSAGVCRSSCVDECPEAQQRTCDGSGYKVCGNHDSDSCREWGPRRACGAGTTCSNGQCLSTCTDECSVVGAKRCELDSVVTCGRFDADSCLEWGSPQPCEGELVCSAGRCESTCRDECTQSGAKACNEAGGVMTCGQFDSDSCLDWSPASVCPGTQACSGGSCQETCSNDCSLEGERRCEAGTGAAYRTCGRFDADPCLDWGSLQQCSGSLVCSAGSCVSTCTNACTAGARRCANGGRETCGDYNSDGCTEWGTGVSCPRGSACDNGSCIVVCTDACPYNSQQCSGNGYQRCADHNGDGCYEWGTTTACTSGNRCVNGTCSASAPPTISITAPAASAKVRPGTSVRVGVTAAAGVGGTLARVEYRLASAVVATVTTAPWDGSVAIPAGASGNQVITATVVDDFGATATASVTLVATANWPSTVEVAGQIPNWATAAADGTGAVILTTMRPEGSSNALATNVGLAARFDASLSFVGTRSFISGQPDTAGDRFLHTRAAVRRGTNSWFLLRRDRDPDVYTLARVPDVGAPSFITVPRPTASFMDESSALLVNVPDGVLVALANDDQYGTVPFFWVFDDAGNELRRWSPGRVTDPPTNLKSWQLTAGASDASGRVFLTGKFGGKAFLTAFPHTLPQAGGQQPRFTMWDTPNDGGSALVVLPGNRVVVAGAGGNNGAGWLAMLDVPATDRPTLTSLVAYSRPQGFGSYTSGPYLAPSGTAGELQLVLGTSVTEGAATDGCVVANVSYPTFAVRSAWLNNVANPPGRQTPECVPVRTSERTALLVHRYRSMPDFVIAPLDAQGRAEATVSSSIAVTLTALATPTLAHSALYSSPFPQAGASTAEPQAFRDFPIAGSESVYVP